MMRVISVLVALLLSTIVLTGCLFGPDDGDGDDDADRDDAMMDDDGMMGDDDSAARDAPEVAELQRTAPEAVRLLDRAGFDEENPERPENTRATQAGFDNEAAGRFPRMDAPYALFTHPGLDCDVPSFHDSRFDGFDDAVEEMMDDWGIMSSTLAISNECKTFYDQGYGVMGPWWLRNAPASANFFDFGPKTPDDALVRVASIVKPITAAAIHDLDERGFLDKDDFAICVPGGPSNCILDITLPVAFDPRIEDITVRDLVNHRGGFDRNEQTDYLFRAKETYDGLGLGSTPKDDDFAEYMLSLGLDFAPDAEWEYSNLGYLILGLVIEEVSGTSYLNYIQNRILNPLGIDDDDVVISTTKREQRNPREIGYWCIDNDWGGNSPISTFPGEVGERECWANGGWVLEAMAAHGGLSMTAAAVADFYAHWWNLGNPRDDYMAFPDPDAVAYSHNGRLASVHTIAARCTNGLNVAWLTNQHAWATFDYDEATERLCSEADQFLGQGPYYTALFTADDDDAWVSHHQTPAADYQARWDELSEDGYRLVDVNGYLKFGKTHYAHAWVKDGDSGWASTHGHDGAAFIERFTELADDGYRLERISCWRDGGGTLRYASVWRENSAGLGWLGYIGHTAAEYQETFDEKVAEGFRLISHDGCDGGGSTRYAHVYLFDPATGRMGSGGTTATAFAAFGALTGTELQEQFDDYTAAGYRVTDVDVYQVGNNIRYAVVFTKETGTGWLFFFGWNFYNYQPNWAETAGQGFRLLSTSAAGDAP